LVAAAVSVVAEIFLDQAGEDATLFPPRIFRVAIFPARQRVRSPAAVACRRADQNVPPPELVHRPAGARPSYPLAIGLLASPVLEQERVRHKNLRLERNHHGAKPEIGQANLRNFQRKAAVTFSVPRLARE
jgi:hypothetical protein